MVIYQNPGPCWTQAVLWSPRAAQGLCTRDQSLASLRTHASSHVGASHRPGLGTGYRLKISLPKRADGATRVPCAREITPGSHEHFARAPNSAFINLMWYLTGAACWPPAPFPAWWNLPIIEVTDVKAFLVRILKMPKSPSESLYWVLWNKTLITHHMSKGTVEDWTSFGENRWSSSWSQVACLWVPDPSCCETLRPLPGFSLVNKFLLPKKGRTLGWELENPDSMCCYSIDFLSLGFPGFKMELAGKVKPKYETIFTMIQLNLLWINKVCCWFSVAGLH